MTIIDDDISAQDGIHFDCPDKTTEAWVNAQSRRKARQRGLNAEDERAVRNAILGIAYHQRHAVFAASDQDSTNAAIADHRPGGGNHFLGSQHAVVFIRLSGQGPSRLNGTSDAGAPRYVALLDPPRPS